MATIKKIMLLGPVWPSHCWQTRKWLSQFFNAPFKKINYQLIWKNSKIGKDICRQAFSTFFVASHRFGDTFLLAMQKLWLLSLGEKYFWRNVWLLNLISSKYEHVKSNRTTNQCQLKRLGKNWMMLQISDITD